MDRQYSWFIIFYLSNLSLILRLTLNINNSDYHTRYIILHINYHVIINQAILLNIK